MRTMIRILFSTGSRTFLRFAAYCLFNMDDQGGLIIVRTGDKEVVTRGEEMQLVISKAEKVT